MPGAEIVDRSAIEILLDYGRTDVGRACHRRRISEPLADGSHHRRDHALLLRRRLCGLTLGERHRRGESASPRAEVLCGELRAHVLADVLVQTSRAEVHELVVVPVAKE